MPSPSQRTAPIPARNGIAPSFLQLPTGDWPDLLHFLIARFPHIAPEIWQQRLAAGQVFDHLGQPHSLHSPYPANRRIWYYRELAIEPHVPFGATVLYQDGRLVVADKPHFLASIPCGRYAQETLLTRLRRQLDLPQLTPIHRLDRETAGVMVFCADPACRGGYQTLFQTRSVHKTYEALAPLHPDLSLPRTHRSRLVERADSFVMEEVAGEPNSETQIALLAAYGGLGHYRLSPLTGRKHQLRVHLSSLGIPIVNDPWYPTVQADKPIDDFSQPLQLLARDIAFTDPYSGVQRRFESRRVLGGIDAAY